VVAGIALRSNLEVRFGRRGEIYVARCFREGIKRENQEEAGSGGGQEALMVVSRVAYKICLIFKTTESHVLNFRSGESDGENI
jgi:hypothetical protein